jgi:ABC-2 type transport system permease protein
MTNHLYLSLRVHFLNFIRNKGAFFWALTFPAFLYVIFYSVFSAFNGEAYALYLLTGVIGMTLTADGLFGVGTVIKQNYLNGTIRLLRKMPIGILTYFTGMVLNRFLIIAALLLLLNLAALLVAGQYLPIEQVPGVCLGIFCGLWIFSFLGLSLAFFQIKSSAEKGLANVVYFFMLFTSNSFYQLGMFNEKVARLADYLPLNNVLYLMRGESPNLPVLLLWMLVPIALFYVLFTKTEYTR